MVIVTGMVTGEERSQGTLDDGKGWTKHVLVILDGTRTREVRLDKGWEGPIPPSGKHVAIECAFGFGNKLHGQRVLPDDLTKALTQTRVA